MKRQLDTLICTVVLILFACGGLPASASLPTLTTVECAVARTDSPTDQEEEDNACDIADNDDAGDDSVQAKQQELFAVLPQSSLSLSSASKYVVTSTSSPHRTSLDVSRIPNRAPPLV